MLINNMCPQQPDPPEEDGDDEDETEEPTQNVGRS